MSAKEQECRQPAYWYLFAPLAAGREGGCFAADGCARTLALTHPRCRCCHRAGGGGSCAGVGGLVVSSVELWVTIRAGLRRLPDTTLNLNIITACALIFNTMCTIFRDRGIYLVGWRSEPTTAVADFELFC